jgi:hypothetical protein
MQFFHFVLSILMKTQLSEKLRFLPTSKLKRAKQRPIYYKTECMDCDVIINVKWERKYVGILPTLSSCPIPKQEICPFCESSHLNTLKINEQQYIEINKQWDFISTAAVE